MNDDTRDLDNLTDYLMRATHEQIVTLAGALARELIARGLPSEALTHELLPGLRLSKSTRRAPSLVRP